MNVEEIYEKIQERGYFVFKTKEKTPLIGIIKDDDTLFEIDATVGKIIGYGKDHGEMSVDIRANTYTKNDIKQGSPLLNAQDLKYEIVQEGKTVCESRNGMIVTLTPTIIQINRTGIRLKDNEEQYEIVTGCKLVVTWTKASVQKPK